MSKYIFWKKKIINKINKLSTKYDCEIQVVSSLQANACVVKIGKKYFIFVSEKIEKKILPLTLFHEFGHIKFNTINTCPQKYNYFNEMLSNLYAFFKLSFQFSFHQKLKLLTLTIFSEKKLYEYFKTNNILGGDYIYEKIFTNK